jgi:hypothetical protein
MSAQAVQTDCRAARRSSGGTRLTMILTIVFALMVLVPSMLGFVAKFIELVAVLQGDADGVFAITPILNYLLASLGFFCMLIWATQRGMFRDIESGKQAMLEQEMLLDRRSAAKEPG